MYIYFFNVLGPCGERGHQDTTFVSSDRRPWQQPALSAPLHGLPRPQSAVVLDGGPASQAAAGAPQTAGEIIYYIYW